MTSAAAEGQRKGLKEYWGPHGPGEEESARRVWAQGCGTVGSPAHGDEHHRLGGAASPSQGWLHLLPPSAHLQVGAQGHAEPRAGIAHP